MNNTYINLQETRFFHDGFVLTTICDNIKIDMCLNQRIIMILSGDRYIRKNATVGQKLVNKTIYSSGLI